METLGESRSPSLASFFRLEKKLDRDPEQKRIYDKFLKDYEALGHMTKLTPEEASKPTRVFVPHHLVFRESSSTTSLRVVFNGFFLTLNGKSLNEIFHIGPKLQSELPSIILRWRLHRFVLSADIEKMFRQIDELPKIDKSSVFFGEAKKMNLSKLTS